MQEDDPATTEQAEACGDFGISGDIGFQRTGILDQNTVFGGTVEEIECRQWAHGNHVHGEVIPSAIENSVLIF